MKSHSLFPFLLIIFLFVLGAAKPAHDFHVSVTVAELNAKNGNLEIYMKLFTEDLEGALGKADIGKSNIAPYFNQRFYFIAEGKTYAPKFVGQEVENELTFVYFEVKDFPECLEISVHNEVLFELFADQSNIINLEINGETRSAFLNKRRAEETLRF